MSAYVKAMTLFSAGVAGFSLASAMTAMGKGNTGMAILLYAFTAADAICAGYWAKRLSA